MVGWAVWLVPDLQPRQCLCGVSVSGAASGGAGFGCPACVRRYRGCDQLAAGQSANAWWPAQPGRDHHPRRRHGAEPGTPACLSGREIRRALRSLIAAHANHKTPAIWQGFCVFTVRSMPYALPVPDQERGGKVQSQPLRSMCSHWHRAVRHFRPFHQGRGMPDQVATYP